MVRYLGLFTLMNAEERAELEEAVREEPHARAAQKALAADVTRRLHGESGLAAAERATQALFGGDVAGLSANEISDVFSDVPSSELAAETLSGDGTPVVDLLADCGLATSKGDARRSIEGGGVYVNGTRVETVDRGLTGEDTIEGRFILLRKGKKRYHLVALKR